MTERPVPEMIPAVTVFWYSPNALPMAITCCPTVIVFESPRVAAAKSETPSIFKKAMSFRGSVATTSTFS